MYLLGETSAALKVVLDILGVAGILIFGTFVLVFLADLVLSGLSDRKGIFFNRKSPADTYEPVKDAPVEDGVMYYQQPNPEPIVEEPQSLEEENVTGVDFDKAIQEQKELMSRNQAPQAPVWEDEEEDEDDDITEILDEVTAQALAQLDANQKAKSRKVYKIKTPEEPVVEDIIVEQPIIVEDVQEEVIEEPVVDEEKLALEKKIAELEEQRRADREELLNALQELKDKEPVIIEQKQEENDKKFANIARMNARLNSIKRTTEKLKDKKEKQAQQNIVTTTIVEEVIQPVVEEEVIEEIVVEPVVVEEPVVEEKVIEEVIVEKVIEKPRFKKDYYLNRLETLQNELKEVQKELKTNNKEYQPLVKVKKAYDRDVQKLRRKEAQVAKQKVAIYGVNKSGKINDQKRAKLDENVQLLKELKDSVFNCEQVINKNKDRFPILEKNHKLITKQVKRIQDDIARVNETLKWFEENEAE